MIKTTEWKTENKYQKVAECPVCHEIAKETTINGISSVIDHCKHFVGIYDNKPAWRIP